MPTSIAQQLEQNSANFFSDEGFLVFLDDHVKSMLDSGTLNPVAVAPTAALKYRHDFSGLLNHLKVPYPCHTACAYINRIKGNRLPDSYQVESILIPDANSVRAMYNSWKSTSATRK